MTSPSTDHIQLLVDERQYKQQINSKLDIVVAKMDQLSDRVSMGISRETPDSHTSSGISAKALLQTIQRIVADNDRLHTEVEDKTGTLDKLRDQVNDLLVRNQHIVDENNKYIEERNRNYNDTANVHKKKMDELIDQKEALQIEISDAAANMAATSRKFEGLKKKYIGLNEVFTSMKDDLDRERKLREKEKAEADAAAVESNNFMQKYREENRKMKEAINDRDELQQTLNGAKEQIERLTRQLEERAQLHSREKAQLEAQQHEERNNLSDQIESLKSELRSERASGTKRVQEIEETMAAQSKQQMQELKASVVKELERRVALEVDKALVEAAVKAEEVKQQAVTEARHTFATEKDRATKLLHDDFNVRLQQETRLSFEKGKQTGFKEGTLASEKTAQALAQTQAQLKEMETRDKASVISQIRELENQLKTQKVEHEKQVSLLKRQGAGGLHHPPGNDREELEKVVKNIVNETFRSLRTEFDPELEYSGATIIQTVRTIMVTKTLGALPKPEPAEPEQSEPAEPEQSELPDQSESTELPEQSEQSEPTELPDPSETMELLPEQSEPAEPEPYRIPEQPEFTPMEQTSNFPPTESFFRSEPESEFTPVSFFSPTPETEQNLDDVILREESSEEPGIILEGTPTEDRIAMTTAEQSESADPLDQVEKAELPDQSEEVEPESEKSDILELPKEGVPLEIDSIFEPLKTKENEIFPKERSFFDDEQWDEDDTDIKKKTVKKPPVDDFTFPEFPTTTTRSFDMENFDRNITADTRPNPVTDTLHDPLPDSHLDIHPEGHLDVHTHVHPDVHPDVHSHALPEVQQDIFPDEDQDYSYVRPTDVHVHTRHTDHPDTHSDKHSDTTPPEASLDPLSDPDPVLHPTTPPYTPLSVDFVTEEPPPLMTREIKNVLTDFADEEVPEVQTKTPFVASDTADILGLPTDPLGVLWDSTPKTKKSVTLEDLEGDDGDDFLSNIVKGTDGKNGKKTENLFDDDESDLFS